MGEKDLDLDLGEDESSDEEDLGSSDEEDLGSSDENDDENDDEKLDFSKVFMPFIARRMMIAMESSNRDDCIKWLKGEPKGLTIYKKILDYLVEEDYPNFLSAAIEAMNAETKSTPLHDAAFNGLHNVVKLLIDYGGLDPNVRHDYHYPGGVIYDCRILKQALPLQVALEYHRLDCRRFDWCGSVFRLICKMCTKDWRHMLETARVLALHTKEKELDQEILKYVKEGEVVYLCALMFVGYYPRIIPYVECFEGDEITKRQMLELVDVFEKIGDKLQAYIRMPRSNIKKIEVARVVMDIASLYKDAGLTVKSIDTIMYYDGSISLRELYDTSPREDHGTVGAYNGSLSVDNNRAPLSYSAGVQDGVQDLNGSDMVPNIASGFRSLHTTSTSITKVNKDLALSFPRKGYVVSMSKPYFWKNSSFWMMALRKAVGHL